MSEHRTAENDAREAWAEVTPTGLDVEPTGTVEVSIELLRLLCSDAGWTLHERPIPPAAAEVSR